jgi:hypothetical protein
MEMKVPFEYVQMSWFPCFESIVNFHFFLATHLVLSFYSSYTG